MLCLFTDMYTGYQCSTILFQVLLATIFLPESLCLQWVSLVRQAVFGFLLPRSTSYYIFPPLSRKRSPVDGTGLSARKHHNSRSSKGSNVKKTPLHKYARMATMHAISASIQ